MTLLIVQFGKGKYNLRRKVGGHWKSTLRLTLSLVTELASVSSDEHNAAQHLTNFKKVNLCIAHLIQRKYQQNIYDELHIQIHKDFLYPRMERWGLLV